MKICTAYDACLETFSVPVRNLVEYDFDDDFSMTVTSDSAYLYRYLDATPLVDYLYACINQTIDVVLKNELDLLHKYRQVKQAINREMDETFQYRVGPLREFLPIKTRGASHGENEIVSLNTTRMHRSPEWRKFIDPSLKNHEPQTRNCNYSR